jgi:hypothetical protein
MSTYEANQGGQRRTRLWIVETLVVLGVLAFGYFALTLDAARIGAPPVETADPLVELIR